MNAPAKPVSILWLALIALPLSLGACGSDEPDGPTKAETVAAAAGLCKAANAQAGKESVEFTDDNPVVFLAAVESRYDIVKPMFAKMKAIDPSEDGRGQWDAFIAAQGRAIAAMDQFKAFVENKPTGSGDETRSRFQDEAHNVLDAGDVTADEAATYGANECSDGPYVQSPGYEIKAATPTDAPLDDDNPNTKRFDSTTLGTFYYPVAWHKKGVTGESSKTSVAFGDDASACAVIVTERAAPGGKPGNGQAATRYARVQASDARKSADSYSLIELGPVQAGNIEGAQIVRRFTTDGEQQAGTIAFFFDDGKRFAVDCKTTDVDNFESINADQFEPLIAGYLVPGNKPK